MKKIGLFICGKVRTICAMNGCLNAIKNREGKFEMYDESPDLKSIIICSDCEKERNDFQDLIRRMKKNDVDTIHFGVCAKMCELNRVSEFEEMFLKENIKVEMGTHREH